LGTVWVLKHSIDAHTLSAELDEIQQPRLGWAGALHPALRELGASA
jgi:hypothetical protein